MFIEYKPELSSTLADIHAQFCEGNYGIHPIPSNHWESLAARTDIDPRNDIIILGDGSEIKGFCWVYAATAPSHVYLRGPFARPGQPDTIETVTSLTIKATERAVELSVGHIEGRAVYAEWSDVYKDQGFERAGAYERWKLFPLKGTVKYPETPTGGRIRYWKGLDELSILMDLFTASFKNHWDYEEPVVSDWIEILKKTDTIRNILRLGEIDGKVIGFAFGQYMPELSLGSYDTAYLISISVHPDYRLSGWGQVLLGDWMRHCYEGGIRSIELDMDEKNTGASALYKSFGFRCIRTEGVWRKYL